MTIPAFQRLARVLDLEEKQKWRNRGVVGGLQAMAGRWADDAHSEGADPRTVAALAGLMRRYGAADAAERPALAADHARNPDRRTAPGGTAGGGVAGGRAA